MTLLKNIECYSPEYLGKKDIIIAGDKINRILPCNQPEESSLIEQVIDCDGLMAFPGIIDQHVHIIGGGGENGFSSRIDEIDINDILNAGVTTLVGILGADRQTKNLSSLLAKARALEEQGITAFIYTGSYSVPPVTLTGSIERDMVLIDKVIGAGEIAISDHRSSQPTLNDLIKLSAEVHLGGLVSGKAGIVHFHVGDEIEGLEPLINIIKQSKLPIEQFVPTHVNRNANLFSQATEFCKGGGNIDITAGETVGISVCDAVFGLIENNVDMSRVTVSSDANGSIPSGGVGKIQSLYDDIVGCVIKKNISPEIAFQLISKNVAGILKLYPKKGAIQKDSDADIIIADKNYKIQKLFCKGKILLDKK